MKSKKILIVEDEQIIAENLRFIINEFGYTFVDVAMNPIEAKDYFKNTNYDLVLMDINLGESSIIDGIDLINQLSQMYNFAFVYVTANADEQTVQKAKLTNPAGYIVKPFMKPSIYANIEIALNTLKYDSFFVYQNKGIQNKIPLSKITYIEADGPYITIYTNQQVQHLVRKTLSDFLALHPTVFIRIHKSILVNKASILGYTSLTVRLEDKKLPLGRTYKQQFMTFIKDSPLS